MKKTSLIFSFLTFSIFFSCNTKDELFTEGYAPIYVEKSKMHSIYSSAALPIVNPGKIYLYGNLVFINEKGRGVHIVDNSNPSSPVLTHFISIPGNYDIAIKNNHLYADNIYDLVTIDINNLSNITVVSRIRNVYDFRSQLYPDFHTGYFECVDTSLGYVIGWKKAELSDPKCRR